MELGESSAVGVSLALSDGLEFQKVRAGSLRGVEDTGDIGPYALNWVEGCGGVNGERLDVMENGKVRG